MSDQIEAVIGLEVHVQLATNSKIFSSDLNSFGDDPNTNIGPITIAHPGTLPVVNREVVDMAMKLGIALDCHINRELIFDRKNYFYPDLPKGYQITQDATPICIDGGIPIEEENGNSLLVELTKIHLEEDAGKSMHVDGTDYTNVDLNRAGTPLVEIVTEPVITNSTHAGLCLAELRKLVRHLGISDGNMEEGSLRCDANVSVRRVGEPLGSKVEVKNMNSIRNVRRAIDHEIERQTKMLVNGDPIISEIRTFNVSEGTTSGMRMKEELNDYRYFPEPDISPISITEEWFEEVKRQLPRLPREIKKELVTSYSLSKYNASLISEDKSLSDYFFQVTGYTKSYKDIANWMLGVIKSYLNEKSIGIDAFPITPKLLADVIELVCNEQVSQTDASKQLFDYLLVHPDETAQEVAVKLDLIQKDNHDEIQLLIDEVLNENLDKVKAYHNGKKGLTGMFMGQLMKKSSGGIDPKKANRLIVESLNKLK